MRNLIESFKHSFSARLSLWVVLFSALISLAAQAFVFMHSRHSLEEEAIKGATQVLDNATLRLNNILEDVELAADNIEWLVYRHLDSKESMLEYSRSAVQGAPFLSGCSISFEPYFFKNDHYFSAYSGYVGDVVQTMQEGSDTYQYFYMDWYLLPKLLNQPCWTEPYSDWDWEDDSAMETDKLVSYCKPLTGEDGAYIGSISMDLSLEWLSETISSVKPYPHSYSILIGRGGSYLVHPDPEKLFYQTIFTQGMIKPDPDVDALGHSMIDWEEGVRKIKLDGVPCYVFYKPLRATGWSMAIVCPRSDVFAGLNRLRLLSLGIALLGLLLMFYVCFRVIKKTVRPLEALANGAENIASGHFDSTLPTDENRLDEIGTLTRSFEHMQSSLVSYIDELTRTTAKKERIEEELKIARSIQMGMVPRTFPPFPDRKDIDLYASITPAKEVGGDLYDFFILNEKLYFCIGDVSGKGVPASLFMSVTRTLFRLLGQQELPPTEIARQINESLSAENEQLMFVTLFIGVADLRTGVLDYCNCGHNPPVLLPMKQGEVAELLDCEANTALGIAPEWEFRGQTVTAFRDRALFLFTDGLNEAENSAHEEFGDARMMEALSSAPFKDSRTTVSLLKKAVAAHVGKAEASDDLTMLCIRLSGPFPESGKLENN